MTNVLDNLTKLVRDFVDERQWVETPKNLAIALSIEASELLKPFQWIETGNSQELNDAQKLNVEQEMADVFIYLLAIADKLNVDLETAVYKKMTLNKIKYPSSKIEK